MANSLQTNLSAVNDGLDFAVLTGKSPLYRYEGKKRTNDIIGTRILVKLPGDRLKPLTVKIEGADPIPQISDEKIVEEVKALKLHLMEFQNCKITAYAIDGEMVLSATATGVKFVNANAGK
jgi:hypothetical protein